MISVEIFSVHVAEYLKPQEGQSLDLHVKRDFMRMTVRVAFKEKISFI